MSEATSPHSADLRRALLAIRDLRQRVAELEAGVREPVAIVGMACRFPGGASTPEAFWEILREGRDVTGEIPSDRWDVDAFYDPDPDAPGKMYVRRGGFLREPLDRFDPGFFGISHKEADAMDPVHRMLLEMTWEALERAGIPPDHLAGANAGVFAGVAGSDYGLLQKGNLADINSYRGTGAIPSVAAGRLSFFLGTHGPNMAVDTACSSALVATALAVDALRSGRCDVALAASAQTILAPEGSIILSKLRALSPDGRCRTFDAGANGYVRSEGGGVFVLKTLARALADGDPILAVIRGVAVNHDGRSSGLTVPNPNAQRAVIEAALRDGGLRPDEVAYVEAHGTGTPLGDPIELRALSAVLGRRTADRPLWVGSVKTNVGHLEVAAAAASLMKVVLSLRHRQIPPHLHLENPTPQVPWSELGIRVPTSLMDWPGGRRLAGISAFGFGGTNAHILVEEAPEPAPDPRSRRPVELLQLSGRSPEAVRELAGRYRDALIAGGSGDAAALVADLAATSVAGRSALAHRAAVVGADATELAEALDALARGEGEAPTHVRGGGDHPIAFLFTGQGSQYPEMAGDLHATSPTFRDALERCAAIADRTLDRPLLPLVLDGREGGVLHQTRYTQPALFAVEYALSELWRSWGVEPDYVLGHSLGEYVAATVAGVMTLEEALPLVVERGRLMQALPAGGRMTSFLASEERVREAMAGVSGADIAAVNAPEGVVVSGPRDAVGEVVALLESAGVKWKDLEVSHAFHSSLMDPMLPAFEEAVRGMSLRAPSIPLVSNLTGEILTPEEAVDPVRWRRHIREPVRFSPSIRRLEALGVRTFVEMGPHPVLSGMGAQSVRGPATWLPSLRRGVPAWHQLSRSAGDLFRSGHGVDGRGWTRDHAGRRGSSAPTYPFQRERFWFSEETGRRGGGPPAARVGVESRHPLLGVGLRSPAIEGWVFERELASGSPSWLAHHRVRGAVVVPGAVWLEMMIGAVREGVGWGVVRLEDIVFEAPLALPREGGSRCQVIVRPAGDGMSVRVVSSSSRDEGPDDWVTHARATARRALADEGSAGAETGAAAARTLEPATTEGLYRGLEARGLEYGATFRVVRDLAAAGNEALGHIELESPAREAAERFTMHPALVDAGFQILDAVPDLPSSSASAVFLPSGAESFRVLSPGFDRAVIRVRLREGGDRNAFSADLEFRDDDGNLLAEVAGFEARRLRSAPGGRTGETALELEWEEVPRPQPAPDRLPGSWLVLEDAGAVLLPVAREIRRRGGDVLRLVRPGCAPEADVDVVEVDPAVPDAWAEVRRRLEGLGPLQGVLHGWSLDGRPTDVVDEVLQSASGVPGRLPIEGAVSAPYGLRLVVRAVSGEGDGGSGVTGAAMRGIAGVVAAEYPELPVRVVELDRAVQVEADTLLDLLLGESPEDRFALGAADSVRSPRLVPIPRRLEGVEVPRRTSYRVTLGERGTLDAIGYGPDRRRAPAAGEVEVRIQATGLNFRDVLNVLGMYPDPSGLPGVEFSGVVTRIGEGVGHVAEGDLVMGIGEGAFASYLTGPAAAVFRAPGSLSPVEAASIPLAFLTAEYGLADLAGLRPGERVLIHAAAGGVGQAAVQLATALGAEVLATAGSEIKRTYLRERGVRHVFDSRSPSFADDVLRVTEGRGVDVVLNSLTGELLRRSLDLLGPGGRFLELGKAEVLDPGEVARSHPGVRYHAYDLGALLLTAPDAFQSLFERVACRFGDGELRPPPIRAWPAEGIVEAFRFMAQARHIGKLVVVARHPAGDGDPVLDAEGAYIVTGAAGGVGRAVVEWLVSSGVGAVVLNGRSEPSADVRAWMERLQGRGTRLAWSRGDVAVAEECRRVVATAAELAPLRGVFHAAGTLDDALLPQQTDERMRRVLSPKVTGTRNLHEWTRNHPLDSFVLFSSAAAGLGGGGQGNYAAANAAMEAIARERRLQGWPALSVQWGAWDGAGMAGRLGDRERRYLEDGGLGFLDPDIALATLEELMASGVDEAFVARIDWDRVSARAGRIPPLVQRLVGAKGSGTEDPGSVLPGVDLADMAALDPDGRRAVVSGYLGRTLAAVLGLRGREVREDEEVALLGFDSLMAMELRNRVEADLGVLVPVARLLGSGTAGDLVEQVVGQLEQGEDSGIKGVDSRMEGEI